MIVLRDELVRRLRAAGRKGRDRAGRGKYKLRHEKKKMLTMHDDETKSASRLQPGDHYQKLDAVQRVLPSPSQHEERVVEKKKQEQT